MDSSRKMTSDFGTGGFLLLRTNDHTVSRSRHNTTECARTRRVANLHVSITRRCGRVRDSPIDGGRVEVVGTRVGQNTIFFIFKSCVERARAALKSQNQCTCLLETTTTSATDERNKFCWTVQTTSFPQTPNLAASASRAL